jgi:hypothetical protein
LRSLLASTTCAPAGSAWATSSVSEWGLRCVPVVVGASARAAPWTAHAGASHRPPACTLCAPGNSKMCTPVASQLRHTLLPCLLRVPMPLCADGTHITEPDLLQRYTARYGPPQRGR